ALGGEPGAACVDDVLAAELAELRDVRGLVAQLDALKACSVRDAGRLEPCQQTLRRGFEAARERDPETHRLWAELYSEEKVSGSSTSSVERPWTRDQSTNASAAGSPGRIHPARWHSVTVTVRSRQAARAASRSPGWFLPRTAGPHMSR